MIFEQLLFQAKEGDLESITDILNMYRPLLLKYSVIDGRLDEDLYQEQCITLWLSCFWCSLCVLNTLGS